MKKTVLATILAVTALNLSAENNETLLNIQGETRFDYQRDWLDGTTVKDNTGFMGRYLNLRANGTITKGLSYSWRQRLNKTHADASFFDATDWLYLNYDINDRWSVAGGKQVVGIGGWEYDRAPIDLYGCSVFWNNVPCYQIGASGSLNVTQNDKLTLQFCESPFHTKENRDMYAYNLMWHGKHGCFTSLYSANLIEYTRGHYISYIALGNKLNFDKVQFEFDIMNRAAEHQKYFFKDMSIMGELSFRINEKWNIFGKATYDVNKTGSNADMIVSNGTELTMVGAGAEFYPVQNNRHSVRIHANCFYSFGKNGNPANEMQDKTMILNVGVKWYMNFFTLKHKQ